MTEVLGYVTDVIKNINAGNLNYCRNLAYPDNNVEQFKEFEAAIKQLVDRQLYLEKETAKYQALLSETDSVIIINPRDGITTDNSSDTDPLSSASSPSITSIDSTDYSSARLSNLQTDNTIIASAGNAGLDISKIQHLSAPDYPSNLFAGQKHPVFHDERVCPVCLQQSVEVALAVTAGDFKRRITCPYASGQMLTLKNAINTMADTIDGLFLELIHVAREVGDEGKLGVKAQNQDLDGAWKEFVVNLNLVTSNHSKQVRDIAEVCTSVARGDLSKKSRLKSRVKLWFSRIR